MQFRRYPEFASSGQNYIRNRVKMKKKSRYIIGFVGLIIVVIGLYLFLRKVETTFYIGIANQAKNIDLQIKIDNNKIFNDTIKYNPFKYIIIKKQLKGGFHKLEVQSVKANLSVEKTILLILNQHVIIEYFPKGSDKEGASFFIRNRLHPFYLE